MSAPVIYSCIGCALLFAFLWLVLLRLFAHFMVWFTVTALGGGCALGAYFMWQTQADMKASPRCAHPAGLDRTTSPLHTPRLSPLLTRRTADPAVPPADRSDD